ncbi:hypothetical protein BC829DRAFT_424243, partial [Chytridium lagenaria]
ERITWGLISFKFDEMKGLENFVLVCKTTALWVKLWSLQKKRWGIRGELIEVRILGSLSDRKELMNADGVIGITSGVDIQQEQKRGSPDVKEHRHTLRRFLLERYQAHQRCLECDLECHGRGNVFRQLERKQRKASYLGMGEVSAVPMDRIKTGWIQEDKLARVVSGKGRDSTRVVNSSERSRKFRGSTRNVVLKRHKV